MIILSNNNQIEFTIKTIYSCHCLDYRDTILALKASGVSNSTMSGASRFQSRTVLGKNDIFLVSIREDGIWNDLLCDFLVFRPVGISLFSLLMATSSLSILYSITSLASFLLSASGFHFSLCMMLLTLDLFLWLFATYLAALLCTASTLFISACVYGSQTVLAYSTSGRARVKYACSFINGYQINDWRHIRSEQTKPWS